MSDLYGVAATAPVAIGSGATRTVVQIAAPANHRVKILGWSVAFDGVNATAAPIRVRLLRQTSAGTMTGFSPTKTTPRAETLLVTAQHTATAEPVTGDLLDTIYVHPQQGYEVMYTPGQERVIGGGGWVGIEVLPVNGINAIAKIFFEE